MSIYDEQYYIIKRDNSYEELSVTPTKETAKRKFKFKKLIIGEKATVFSTETNDLNFTLGEPEILFSAPNFIISERLKNEIKNGLFGSQFYPAIITAKNGEQRDDFWLLNTFSKLDCWHRERSIIDDPDDFSYIDEGIEIFPTVSKYSLDEKILANIDESQRLIFKMAKTSTQPIFVHQKVVDTFNKYKVKGVKFYKISEYEFGDEF